MDITRAIHVLEKHNEYRRDRNVPSKVDIQNPTEIGQAIDLAVQVLKTSCNETAQDEVLERLYEWLIDGNREPAKTKFTSGMLRNVANEIEFQIHCSRSK